MSVVPPVQSNSGQYGHVPNGTAVTIAFASNVSAGNLLVMGIGEYDSNPNWTITDSQGNTWSQVGTYATAASRTASLWVAVAGTNSPCTVSALANTGSPYPGIAIAEYSGVTNTVRSVVTATGNSASPSPGAVAAQSGDLVVAICGGGGTSAASIAVSSPLTEEQSQPNGASNGWIGLADAQATGPVTPVFAISSGYWAAVGAAFQSSGGVTASLSATLGGVTASLPATASVPSSSSGALNVTLGNVLASLTASASAPAATSGVVGVMLGGVVASLAATAGVPAGATANLVVTTGNATASLAATAGVPSPSTGTLSTTTGGVTASYAATASAPGGTTGTLTTTTGGATASFSATAAAPAGSTATLSSTLGGATASFTATAAAPSGSAGSPTDGVLVGLGSLALPFGSGVVLAAPVSLQAAIYAAWKAAGLTSSIGTLYSGRAARGLAPPHVVMTVPDSVAGTFFSGGQADDTRVYFRCRATTAAGASTMARAIDAWMIPGREGLRFGWERGGTGPAWRCHVSSGEEPGLAVGGVAVFFQLVGYSFRTRGAI